MNSWQHAYEISTGGISVAEIADGTQILCVLLADHYRRVGGLKWCVLGLGLSALLAPSVGVGIALLVRLMVDMTTGGSASNFLPHALSAGLCLFLAFRSFKEATGAEGGDEKKKRFWDDYGPFSRSFLGFFVMEAPDRTQMATGTLTLQGYDWTAVWAGAATGLILMNLGMVTLSLWAGAHVPRKVYVCIGAVAFLGWGLYLAFQAATDLWS